jgi:DNA-binding transcriptional ArsR family regulator
VLIVTITATATANILGCYFCHSTSSSFFSCISTRTNPIKLDKSKLVKAKRLGYNTIRYYPIAVKPNESNVLDHLLNSTRRKIIFFLLGHSNYIFKEIVHYIDRAQSTTLFQLRRLEYAGIISVLREDKNNQFYRLKNRARIIKTVSKYKIR